MQTQILTVPASSPAVCTNGNGGPPSTVLIFAISVRDLPGPWVILRHVVRTDGIRGTPAWPDGGRSSVRWASRAHGSGTKELRQQTFLCGDAPERRLRLLGERVKSRIIRRCGVQPSSPFFPGRLHQAHDADQGRPGSSGWRLLARRLFGPSRGCCIARRRV
jgi:hypothetical protein